MYGREYRDQVLNFEPSGALKQATLVMRDRETDSWWSIMSGDAIGGNMKGQKLRELAVGERTTWGKWKHKHPNTRVLSIDGKEHDPRNVYEGYFDSKRTFRNIDATDKRLAAKTPIYSFRIDQIPYAAPHAVLAGGAVFPVKGGVVFLHRQKNADLFESTRAWYFAGARAGDFQHQGDTWINRRSGAKFTPALGWADENNKKDAAQPLSGFDTYWYSWANNNAHVVILGQTD